MNRMKQILMLVVVLIVTTTVVSAQSVDRSLNTYGGQQGEFKVNLLYNYSMPTGSFKNDFIDNNSPRGFNVDLMYYFKPEWALGATFGYQDYYQKFGRDLYKLEDGSDVSAVLTNSMQLTPIMAKAVYSPMASKSAAVQPYISAGAGINIVNYSQYLGEFSGGNNNTNAAFAAQAGAGLKVPFGRNKNAGFIIGAAYNFSPYNKNEIDNLNTVNLQAGLQFRLK